MASTDTRRTQLQLVNAVLRRLHLNAVSATTDTKLATILVDKLNEVIADVADFGDWQEMYAETTVSCSANQGTYGLGLDSPIQSVLEVVVSGEIAPLLQQEVREILRLQRLNQSGLPRHFALVGTDSQENPQFRVSPIPSTAEASANFTISYYKKPAMLTTSDDATTPDFPANVLIQGLYAAAVLHENGGEPSQEFQAEQAKYERLRQQALNRYNADTGTDVFFTPAMYGGGPY